MGQIAKIPWLFTDLEKINTGRPTTSGADETVTTKTAKLETSVNFITSTTTTRGNKEIEEPSVTVVRKSVQFPYLPKKSLPPVPTRRSLRRSKEPRSYSVTEDASASGPAPSAKQSFINMVLESIDEYEVWRGDSLTKIIVRNSWSLFSKNGNIESHWKM